VDVLEIAAIEGALLTELTVSTKESWAVRVPSVTVKVTEDVPFWFNAGAIFTVQLGAVPPKVMFATGRRVVLLEDAVRDVAQERT
jgi:hypothetical protein